MQNDKNFAQLFPHDYFLVMGIFLSMVLSPEYRYSKAIERKK